MHGRKRIPKDVVPNEKEVKKKRAKMKAYTKLSTVLLAKRQKGDKSLKTLELTAKMVVVNPDFYTIWGYRREILAHHYNNFMVTSSKNGDDSSEMGIKAVTEDSLKNMYLTELSLTENALLKRNPKSYYAWHHRKWVLANGGLENLEKELLLTEQFLEADERNFHCWNYRRCVLSQLEQMSDAEKRNKEVAFTTKLIQRNFSNYSAWHERSKMLELSMTNIEKELKTVDTAIFTEPDDQTAWIYHRWLIAQAVDLFGDRNNPIKQKVQRHLLSFEYYQLFLDRLKASNKIIDQLGNVPLKSEKKNERMDVRQDGKRMEDVSLEECMNATAWCLNLIDTEITMCKELLRVEPTSKWGKLHLSFLYDKKLFLLKNSSIVLDDIDSIIGKLKNQRVELLEELAKIDSAHYKYYEYELSTAITA